MKKFIAAAAFLALCSPLLFSYEYIMNGGVDFGTGWVSTQVTSLTGGNWDNGYYDLVLPATNQFYYHGKKVTHLRISTNGYVLLGFGSPSGEGSSYVNEPIPKSDDHNSLVAPWWDDWNLSVSGQIWYVVYSGGPGSNNWVTIEWQDVAHQADVTARYTFQAIFYAEYPSDPEWRNCILFNYEDTDSGTGTYDYGKSGTVGIEHYSGIQGEEYSYNTASLNNTLAILFTPFVPVYASTDFWDTGKAALCVFRPSNGYWYIKQNPADGTVSYGMQWGMRGDVAVPGDYDVDGDADECVYRPSNSYWYSATPSFAIQWGQTGDIPVPADYDGDGRTDIAVFRPSNGTWYVRLWAGGSTATQWGDPGDIPIPGDVDNDSRADPVVWRPDNQWFYAKKSTGGTLSMQGGQDGDIPNLGKNGIDNAEPLVFRPLTGRWHTATWGGTYSNWQWGQDGDFPMPVDWEGTGYTWFMVFRATNGTWYQKQMSNTYSYQWGMIGDKVRCRKSHNVALDGNPVGVGTAIN